MRFRNRAFALVGLAIYGAAAFALPVLHHAHHRYDHHHGPDGATSYDAPLSVAPHLETEHVAFDSALASLDLSDVAHAGVASVDCALAEYTLASCDDPHGAPHTFGDELIARLPHSHPSPEPFDPTHGAHSLEHLGLAITGTAPFVIPPPARPSARLPLPTVDERLASTPTLPRRARGPPLRSFA